MDSERGEPDGRERSGQDTSREDDKESGTRDSRGRWMTPQDVADLFGVSPKTVGRWANEGKLGFVTLPSGHRRYSRKDAEWMLKNARRLEQE